MTASPFQAEYGLFINNEWVQAKSGETFESINPATGEVLARVQWAGPVDVDRAVQAAQAAFPGWKMTPPDVRSRLMLQVADKLEARMQELALMETLDNGKPVRECMAVDMPYGIDHWRYFAAAIRMLKGDTHNLNPVMMAMTLREPLGVVGAIIPWNFPFLMTAWKICPAIAAGNTVVLKPAEQTSLTALELCKTLAEVLPPGVVNVVTGDGPITGAALTSHSGVRKLAFTGETATGQKIARAAAENLIPVTLELGGKSPNIIFPDANLEQAVEGVMLGIFFNQGQVCTAGSRLFLHRDIKDRFLDALLTKIEGLNLGDPTQPTTTLGPLVSQEQWDKVSSYTAIGKQEGAKLLCGGSRPAGKDKGYWWSPTVFDNVNVNMRIAREEVFGPFLAVVPWDDYETMIAEANGVIYGLGAGIWTRDLKTAHMTAGRLDAGTIWVNTYNLLFNGVPFGGFKKSGYGRELAGETLNAYTQAKSVIFNFMDAPMGMY